MAWRKQPNMNEKVYVGTCPSCGKVRIKKRHEGKSVYCLDCEAWDYNSLLVPYSVALSMLNKKGNCLKN